MDIPTYIHKDTYTHIHMSATPSQKQALNNTLSITPSPQHPLHNTLSTTTTPMQGIGQHWCSSLVYNIGAHIRGCEFQGTRPGMCFFVVCDVYVCMYTCVYVV